MLRNMMIKNSTIKSPDIINTLPFGDFRIYAMGIMFCLLA